MALTQTTLCALDPYFHLPAEDLHLDVPYICQTNVSRLESFSPTQIGPLLQFSI